MSDLIECFITIATGAPGHGKTKRTTDEIKMYVLNDVKHNRAGRKVLIFDINNEYGEFKTVKYDVTDPNDNGKYFSLLKNSEIRRVTPFAPPDGRPMDFDEKLKTIGDIMANYRNGLVVIEDINKYAIGIHTMKKVISFLCSNRHAGLDIIIHVQSLSAVEPRMWQNARMIRFHYQTDKIDRYEQRIPNFELMKIAQIIVTNEYYKGNKYFFLYVDIQANKIIGVNKKQFLEACKEYNEEYQPSRNRKKDPKVILTKQMLYIR